MPAKYEKHEQTRLFNITPSDIRKIMNNNVRTLEHDKTIAINELPDCKHKKLLSTLVSNQSARIIIIAITVMDFTSIGETGWQVRAGYPCIADLIQPITPNHYVSSFIQDNHDGTEEFGEVLPEEIAVQLFPDWKDRKYVS